MTDVPNYSDYTYGNSYQGMEPYMLYGDRSTQANPNEMKDFVVQDLEYLQGLYPGHMKTLHEYVVSACDHLDYKNSPMYDEFPDRLLINQVCDSICSQIQKDGIITNDQIAGAGNTVLAKPETQKMDCESYETEASDLLAQQRSSTWGPPSWDPPADQRPRCRSGQCGSGQRPPWGQPWGRPWGASTWGPSGQSPYNYGNNWLNDVVSVILLNEMHRRRCRTCR